MLVKIEAVDEYDCIQPDKRAISEIMSENDCRDAFKSDE